MDRSEISKLPIQEIRDIALDSDISLHEDDTKKEILDKIFGDISLVYDPMRYTAIEYLPIEEILNLCETSRDFKVICRDKVTWEMLLWRDFKLKDENPKEKYMEEYQLKQFQKRFKFNMSIFYSNNELSDIKDLSGEQSRLSLQDRGKSK